MALYLVDFENVHDSGLTGVTNLTEHDEVSIFYSVKSEHMSFETHVNIMRSAAKVKYIKLRRSAKNYLDFQLCTHLGYVIGSGQPGPYFIISKDTGYDSVVDYWRDHGVTINRQPSINYNLTQRKSTGQAPTHITPPAIVTLKEGTVISTPQITMIRTTETPSPASGKPFRSNPAQPAGTPQTAAAPAAAAEQKKQDTVGEPKDVIMEAPGTEVPGSTNALPETPVTEDTEKSGKQSSEAKAVTEPETAALSGETAKAPADAVTEKATDENAAEDPEIPETEDVRKPAEADHQENEEYTAEAPETAEAAEVTEAPAGTGAQTLTDETPHTAPQEKKSRSSRSRRNNSRKRAASDASSTGTAAEAAETVPESQPEEEPFTDGPFTDTPSDQPAEEPVRITPQTLPESYRKKVRTALRGKNFPSANYSSIYKAIINSYDKLALNNLLVKTFGSSKGGEIYNLIRDIFTDYQSVSG